jgi:hypothetical protein
VSTAVVLPAQPRQLSENAALQFFLLKQKLEERLPKVHDLDPSVLEGEAGQGIVDVGREVNTDPRPTPGH